MSTSKPTGAAKPSDFTDQLGPAAPKPKPAPVTEPLFSEPSENNPEPTPGTDANPTTASAVAQAPAPVMSEADIAEFQRLKAEEEARKRAAEEAAKTPVKTLAEQMNDDYINNRGTIQTIARHYRVDVDEVLRAIGQEEMATVHTIGDLVDGNELGPTDAPIAPEGQVAKVPFSLN